MQISPLLADAHGQGLFEAAGLLVLFLALTALGGLLLLAAPVAGSELGRRVCGSGSGLALGLILGFGLEAIVMITYWSEIPGRLLPYVCALALGFLAGALPGLVLRRLHKSPPG